MPRSNKDKWWGNDDDIVLLFDRKDSTRRTSEQMERMVDLMRAAANEMGYDISSYGTAKNMISLFKNVYTQEEKDDRPS